MEKLKNLLLVALPLVFVLMVSWLLSMNFNFSWNGIVFFEFVMLVLGGALWYVDSQKLLPAVPWVMCSGTLCAFLCAKGMCGEYEYTLQTMFMTIFAFTIFFMHCHYLYPSSKRKKH